MHLGFWFRSIGSGVWDCCLDGFWASPSFADRAVFIIVILFTDRALFIIAESSQRMFPQGRFCSQQCRVLDRSSPR